MIGSTILLAGLLTVGGKSDQTEEGVKARWYREYPVAAAQHEAIARDFTAKGSYSYRYTNGDTTTTKMLTVAASGDKRLIIRDHKSTLSPKFSNRPDNTDVWCQTADYEFELSKVPLSTHYIIDSYVPYESDDESQFNYYFKNFARCSTVYYGTSLLQRMRDPSFVLKSIEAVKQDDGELVRVGYTYEGKYVFESGAVDLDPGKNWVIRKVEVTCKNKKDWPPYELKSDVEYEKVDETRFFPRRMEFFGRTPKSEIYEHVILKYDDITLGSVPDEIFRMTAYGLPEVPLRPAPRHSVFTFRNPFFWIALAAAVASITLLWAMRSRKTMAA